MPLKPRRKFSRLQIEAQSYRFLEFPKKIRHVDAGNVVLIRKILLYILEFKFVPLFLLVVKLDRLKNGSSDEKVDEK